MSSQPAWSRDSAAIRLDRSIELRDLTPEWAWGGSNGEGVRVAIVDSGIEATHPALGGCVDVGGSISVVLGKNERPQIVEGPHDDSFGHGTACAGIIHALAPAASVTSVRVLDERLTSTPAQFLAGLEWAVDQGFDVINLSLGSSKRDGALSFHEQCDRAYFEGSVVVTAANNVLRKSYPSLFASVVSVACGSSRDPHRFHYNPRPPTEFLAAGIDVEVAWKGGGSRRSTGNSFAAPHIAGVVASIRGKHPELRPFQIKTALYATAANVMEAGSGAVAAPTPPGRVSRTMAGLPAARRSGWSRTVVGRQ